MNSHVVYKLSLLHILLLVYMLGGGGMPVDLVMCILLKLETIVFSKLETIVFQISIKRSGSVFFCLPAIIMLYFKNMLCSDLDTNVNDPCRELSRN